MKVSGTDPQLAPIGTIVAYAGQDPTALEDYGWMTCDGRSLPTAIYDELFVAIGRSFGQPDNNSFNIPMLQGLFLRGVSGKQPANDPDVALRATLKPGGNTGGSVGSYQTYGTAPAERSFKSKISNSAIGRIKTDKGYQTKGAKYNTNTYTYGASKGGDKESRPVNKYIYYLIKYRTFDTKQEYVKVPVGAVIPFAGAAVSPEMSNNWILCDGAALDKAGKNEPLFNAIGFAHGKKSNTQFVLPDYRGYFLRGVNTGTGKDPDSLARTAPYTAGEAGNKGNSGDAVGSAQDTATGLPVKADLNTTFKHLPQGNSKKETNGVVRALVKYNSKGVWVNVSESGGDSETRPPNVNVNWYVRYQ